MIPDMVQILSMLTMERPKSFAANDIRKEKVKNHLEHENARSKSKIVRSESLRQFQLSKTLRQS